MKVSPGGSFPEFNARPRIVPLQCNIDVTSLKVRSQMTRYSMILTIYTFPGFNVRPCIFTITVFVPLQCNTDVTSLKVRSQMTRYSMIQTIYTFPGFNVRPCIFTITVFVPLQCNIDVCTITVQHRCYLVEGQITNDKIFHDSDYLYFSRV